MARYLTAFSLSFLLACGSTGGGDGAGGGGGAGDCAEPASQPLSQPCCLAHGVDACGANLFCAAFDGRTQPTCYPERSRPDGAECTGDVQCTSGACNTTASKCRAAPYASCTTDVGCAPAPGGGRTTCLDDGDGPRCVAIGNGAYGEVCETDADCVDTVCRHGRCAFDLACELPGDGTGPCVEDPAGSACGNCIGSYTVACYQACPGETGGFGSCLNDTACSDATCLLEACGDALCTLLDCASRSCDAAFTCF